MVFRGSRLALKKGVVGWGSTNPILCAIILTLLPRAFFSISWLSLAARSSIDADGGTEVRMTSMLLALRASVMPRQ